MPTTNRKVSEHSKYSLSCRKFAILGTEYHMLYIVAIILSKADDRVTCDHFRFAEIELGGAVNIEPRVVIRMHCTYRTLFGGLWPASTIKYVFDNLGVLAMNRVGKVNETNIWMFANFVTREANIVKWTTLYFKLFAKLERYKLLLRGFAEKVIVFLTATEKTVGEHSEHSLICRKFAIPWAEYHVFLSSSSIQSNSSSQISLSLP